MKEFNQIHVAEPFTELGLEGKKRDNLLSSLQVHSSERITCDNCEGIWGYVYSFAFLPNLIFGEKILKNCI